MPTDDNTCIYYLLIFSVDLTYPVVKVTVDSRGGPKFKNTTLQKWIKHMHHESVIK